MEKRLADREIGEKYSYPGRRLITGTDLDMFCNVTGMRGDVFLSDGPPGIGCPVISSLSGTNLALLVTEPTLSGMHDLERVIGVCRHFDVPVVVGINKYDLNEENTRQIESNCSAQGIRIAGKIPFDNVVTEAIIRGVPVVEYTSGRVTQEIETMWRTVSTMLGNGEKR